MLESKQAAYDDGDPSNSFAGIQFVLFGFDPVREEQVRAKLLEGGAVDAVNYGPDCNHVIVDKVVYDDPICAAARRDGKILVTGIWVDHSFDVGIPVDPSNIMYCPVRNLNGIPGANSLVICLTGYQRQDREDIMNMVALMGANFSKPLVANKVTHLVCYKFEGEKYELAKKVTTMKLVNHVWLEDCLKAWELLPETDYAKSGYQLEMEAEAKDSEEETEDMAPVDLKKKSLIVPHNLRVENKNSHQSPERQGVSKTSGYVTALESFANVGNTSKTQSTPRKETDFGKASLSRDAHVENHDTSNSSSARSPAKMFSGVPSNVPDGTAISESVGHVLASASGSAKKSVDAGLSKSSSKRMKATLPLMSERTETNSRSPLSKVSKIGFYGSFELPTERDLDGTVSHGIRSPLKGSLLLPNEGQMCSPGKKKPTVPRGSSRSPVVSHSPNSLIKNGLATKLMEMPVSISSVDGSSRLASNMSPTKARLREEVCGPFVMPLENIQAGTGSAGVKTPLKGAMSDLDEEHTSSLPGTKKMTVSRSGSKSRRLSRSPITGAICPMEEVGGVFVLPSENIQNGTGSAGVKSPLEGLYVDEEQTSSLPGTKKMTVSRSGSKSTKLCRSPITDTNCLWEEVGGGFVEPPENIQDATVSSGVKTPLKGASLHLDEEEQTNSLPGKKKTTVSRSGSKTKPLEIPVSGSSARGKRQLAADDPPPNVTSCLREEDGGVLNMPSEREEDGVGAKTPLEGASLQLNEEQTSSLPGRRKMALSRSNSKSTKLSRSRKTPVGSVSYTKATEMPVSVSRDEVSPAPKELLADSTLPEEKQECNNQTSKPSRGRPKKRRLPDSDVKEPSPSRTKSCSGGKEMHQRDMPDFRPPFPSTSAAVEKLDDQANLNSSKVDNPSGTKSKSPKKKMLARKTLGTKPTICKGKTTKTKGLLSALLQDKKFTGHSSGLVAVEDTNNASSLAEKLIAVSPNPDVDLHADDGNEAPEHEGPNKIDPVKHSAEVEEPPSRNKPGKKATQRKEAKSKAKKSTNNASSLAEKLVAVSSNPKEDVPAGDETEAPEHEGLNEIDLGSKHSAEAEEPPTLKEPGKKTTQRKEAKSKAKKSTEAKKSVSSPKTDLPESKSTGDVAEKKITEGKKRPLAKSNTNKMKDPSVETKQDKKKTASSNGEAAVLAGTTSKRPSKKSKRSNDVEKENEPVTNEQPSASCDMGAAKKSTPRKLKKPPNNGGKSDKVDTEELTAKTEPAWFIFSGHRLQRKEFQQVIKRLKGRVCRDSHNWSYQATHFIVPDPIRRTEKFFAAAASGSWILKTDYLTASTEAGRLLNEEPYEWHKKCLTEDGAINLEAPRKWRLLRERTGHGAFYGMRIVIYGECIAPPLDTLKRVVKAGDGTILATSPPYTRFLDSRVDFAIVSPGMPRVDMWVQEFLRHEIPCISADYLVEYVCKPGYSLDKHVHYSTHAWAKRSLESLVHRVEEAVDEEPTTPEDQQADDAACRVCGSRDRGDEMLICGDESGARGCGVGTHIDCLDPPLESVPEEDWFCPDCCRSSKKRGTKSKKK